MRKTRNALASSSLVAVALAGPGLALAEETFQAEAGLSYSRFKSDNVRTNEAGVDATYYFDKLPTRPDYPFEQAQFVERAASVGANYGWSSTDLSGFDKVSDGSDYGANFVFARPDSPFIVAGEYQAARSGKSKAPTSSTEFETDSQLYHVAAGLYVAKTTDVLLNWARTTADFKSGGSTSRAATITTVGLSGEHLMRLAGGDYVALTAAVLQDTLEQPNASSEKNLNYVLQATYYPTHMLGITARIQLNRGDDSLAEGEVYGAGVRMFFAPAFSVSLDYLHFAAKAPNNDADRIALRAALRF